MFLGTNKVVLCRKNYEYETSIEDLYGIFQTDKNVLIRNKDGFTEIIDIKKTEFTGTIYEVFYLNYKNKKSESSFECSGDQLVEYMENDNFKPTKIGYILEKSKLMKVNGYKSTVVITKIIKKQVYNITTYNISTKNSFCIENISFITTNR